jgi:hypothetical protein
MKANDITTSPQVSDTAKAYELWHESHFGGMDDFYRFITTPSPERDVFVSRAGETVKLTDGVAVTIINEQQ